MNVVVSSGDTLSQIAIDNNVTVADLMSANGLTSDALQVGQVLQIPQPQSVPQSGRIYVVQAGDTLQTIAAAFGSDPTAIKQANNMTSNALFIGTSIMVPNPPPVPYPTPAPAPVSKVWYYPVQPWSHYNNNSGKFLDPIYYQQIGSEHPGVDLNGNGGGNTDYGDPVYSISDGVVIDVTYEAVWGNLVLVDYGEVLALYAHMSKVLVSTGQRVAPMQQVGAIGRGANNVYLAHLHFEIRKKFPGRNRMPTGNWPSALYPNRYDAQNYIRANYMSPLDFLASKGARTS